MAIAASTLGLARLYFLDRLDRCALASIAVASLPTVRALSFITPPDHGINTFDNLPCRPS
jgi:hypothetical protein